MVPMLSAIKRFHYILIEHSLESQLQSTQLNPLEHAHSNPPFSLSRHVAPFLHGLFIQGEILSEREGEILSEREGEILSQRKDVILSE